MYKADGQRVVKINKADKGAHYTLINKDALEIAMHQLKPSAFKVWIYIGSQRNKEEWVLSCVHTTNFTNMSKPTYLSAVNELIDKGYLIPIENKKDYYNFYEFPQQIEKSTDINKAKEFNF